MVVVLHQLTVVGLMVKYTYDKDMCDLKLDGCH